MNHISMVKYNKSTKVLENIIIFIIMGLIYMGLEMLWRGYTFFSMGIVGGLAGLSIGLINEYDKDMPLFYQGILGTVMVLILEFVSGYILNILLAYNVWDYSHFAYNIMGQVCLYFGILWYFLCILCIFLDDLIRWKFFGREKPSYTLFVRRN